MSRGPAIDTHGLVVDFGRHKGTPWTRVPVNYLFWLTNQRGDSLWKEIAQAEIDRRGSRRPKLNISGHAVDRASTECLKIWEETRNYKEGLHAWLIRMCEEAMADGVKCKGDRIHHRGLMFVVSFGESFPELVTLFPKKNPVRPIGGHPKKPKGEGQ